MQEVVMHTLAKILLPVDFSHRSAGAARYARCLAERCQSEIILVHVLPPLHTDFGPDVAGAMLVDVHRARAGQAERKLAGFLATELAGIPTRRLVLNGDPASEIVQFAHTEPVGLIAMPTHGYGPFRRFILGSNTAKVLHDANCPVWTGVHLEQAPDTGHVGIQNVLCAVDLGPCSGKTLAWAAWLKQRFQAKLVLMHAVAAHPDARGIQDAAREELQHLQVSKGTEAELLLETGEPARAICAAAEQTGASVVVIGRGSAAGDFGRLRTNSYAIIRQSPCPVVSV
jgi:nucleotide-binding universal stress UspA family protein